MAEVRIIINGRHYDIACDNGQEARIVDLARYIDKKVQSIAHSGAAFNEGHVLVLTALVLADELAEEREKSASRAQARPAAAPAPAPAARPSLDEKALASVIEQLVLRIDGIAQRVKAA